MHSELKAKQTITRVLSTAERSRKAYSQKAHSNPYYFGKVVKYKKLLPFSDNRDTTGFEPDEKTFALIRSNNTKPMSISGLSMSQIALNLYRIKTRLIGQICVIEKDGLIIRYLNPKEAILEEACLDLLVARRKIYLTDLGFTKVMDRSLIEQTPPSPHHIRELTLKYKGLGLEEKNYLFGFLKENLGKYEKPAFFQPQELRNYLEENYGRQFQNP